MPAACGRMVAPEAMQLLALRSTSTWIRDKSETNIGLPFRYGLMARSIYQMARLRQGGYVK